MPKTETTPVLDMVECEDILNQIAVAVDKAKYTLQEITDRYFDKFDANKKEDQYYILYDFNRHRAFARILDDLLDDIANLLPESATA